jgi:molybdate transport system ATP-binding protein
VGKLLFDCRLRYPSGFTLAAAFAAGDGVTALFGPSGCGKSTILELIAGVQRPQAGHIRLGEQTLADVTGGIFVPPEQRRIGMVFQDQLLFPHLTVRQNLRFGHGRPSSRAVAFDRVVAVLEIGGLLDRRPAALSGGQRQRVALGRALLRGPELLLMDEPLTALEERLKGGILDYLERAQAEWPVPTLLVSHDPSEVARLANTVVILEHGRVVAAGSTAALPAPTVTPPASQAHVPVNLLQLTDLHQAEGHWHGKLGEQSLQLPSLPITAGSSICVRFLPRKVSLTRGQPAGHRPGPCLHGVVRQVLGVSGRFLVAIDVGQFLWAEVTAEELHTLNLRTGETVTWGIQPNDIAVVD